MKALRFSLFIAAVFMMATPAMAQKIKLKEGNLKALKGEKSFNVQYDYNDMTIGKKKTPEAEYVADKKAEYNKKEAGKGDSWEESWIADREKRFEVQFKEEFEKQSGMTIDKNTNDKYTIIFKTLNTEPGFNVYMTRKNAEIDGEVWIVETANPDNVVAKISVENAPGRTFGGYDFDSGTRIQEAYAVAGKGFGKFLKKETK